MYYPAFKTGRCDLIIVHRGVRRDMMRYVWNNRGSTRIIILAVIFGILLTATIIQRSQRRVVAEKQKQEEEAPLVADFNPDDVYTIEIYQLLSKMVIQKVGDQWRVGAAQIMPNYSPEEKEKAPITAWDKADEKAIREMLETVRDGLKGGELVSRNRDKKIEYRVGILGSKFKFKNEKGQEIACIDVGEKSVDFSGTYVSLCDKDEVYKVPGILEYIFKKDVNEWRDKHVQNLDKNKIVKVEGKGSTLDGVFTIEKGSDGKWQVTSPKQQPADENLVDSLISRLATFEASGFPERLMPDAKITKVELVVTTTTEDGKSYTLTFGSAEMSPEKLVQGSESGIIYTAGYSDVDALTKQMKEILESTGTDKG